MWKVKGQAREVKKVKTIVTTITKKGSSNLNEILGNEGHGHGQEMIGFWEVTDD